MNWIEAEINLRENIHIHDHLDGLDHYKIVIQTPPFICRKCKDEGFRIRVGKTSFINIPLSMLKLVFETSRRNKGIYNHQLFFSLFPTECTDKPCYVHTIGKLFFNAGIMEQLDNRNYRIL